MQNPERLAGAYAAAGDALMETGRHLSARKLVEGALHITKEPARRRRLLGDLAVAHHHAVNALLAEVMAREGLAISKDYDTVKARAHAVLARILFDQGRLDEAEEDLRVAVIGLV